jgi:tetratricopeptide (TPR) repeat protein
VKNDAVNKMHDRLLEITEARRRELRDGRRGCAGRAASGPGRLAAVALVGLFIAAQPAAAEEPRKDASAVAKAPVAESKSARHDELLKQGGLHYTAGRYHVAEAIFLEVWRESRSFDAAVNLGHAEYQLGKMPEAATYFSYALKNWPVLGEPDPVMQKQHHIVKQRFARAKAQLGTLALRVSRPGAEVAIDGKRLEEAPTGTEVFVMPGTHRIEAKLAGYEPAVTTIEVGKNTSSEVALTLKPVEKNTSPEVALTLKPEEPRTSAGKNALIASGAAVSVVMVGVGVGLYVARASQFAKAETLQSEIVKHPGRCYRDPHEKCDALSSTAQTIDELRNWGTAAFITGGVVGAGTLVYSLWPSSKPEVRTGVRVIPVLSDSTGGIEVLGRF